MEDSLSTRFQGNIFHETRRLASFVFGEFEVKMVDEKLANFFMCYDALQHNCNDSLLCSVLQQYSLSFSQEKHEEREKKLKSIDAKIKASQAAKQQGLLFLSWL